MRLKEGFILREVAGETVVVPVGEGLNLSELITLNGTGAFLWRQLEQETTEEAVVATLLDEYDVDEADACAHVAAFIKQLKSCNFLV